MPPDADLYLDRMDLSRHVGAQACQICRVDSLAELLDRLKAGQVCPGQCIHWPRQRVEAFQAAINAGTILPTIPSLDVPRPTRAGPIGLNEPTESSPAMVTSNSELTLEVLLAVLSTATSPLWLIPVDTGGHTVDMSLVFGTLTAEAVSEALAAGAPGARGFTGRIILPGLAEPLADPISQILCRPIEVGPICAAELPLFLGPDWMC